MHSATSSQKRLNRGSKPSPSGTIHVKLSRTTLCGLLIVPELYRPGDATANGTLDDAVAWVEEWLDVDPDLHVYWLFSPPEAALASS
jgi:hypothetical protein